MVSEGTCLCGDVTYSFEAEPDAVALCHCLDCRKISGSTHSLNILVREDTFKVTSGTPKTYKKKADSGNEITSYFCGNCGSTLWRDTATFQGLHIVKAGTVTNPGQDGYKPQLELFAAERVKWQPEMPGADQKTTMT